MTKTIGRVAQQQAVMVPGPSGILVFPLETDQEGFLRAVNAGKMFGAMWDYAQELRNLVKHGDAGGPKYQGLLEAHDIFWMHINDSGLQELMP